MEPTLLSIVGPTAIGKTQLAIALAKHFKTGILSADSRQFYKEMYIGTAVPSLRELKNVPHYFIQHKSIFDDYSVGDFEREALLRLESLFRSKDIVIMVGGSGLYTDAVTNGLDTFPKVDPQIRIRLNSDYKAKGILNLQKRLHILDPVYYDTVDLENPHRLIRALEICIGSGKPYSSFLNQEKPKRPFKVLTLGIRADREILYRRIDQRVELMLKEGLLKEARSLYPHKNRNALQTVGYKELFAYFDNECELDFAISEIKKNTRRFAKRQLTWYRKNKTIFWVDFDTETNAVIQHIIKHIQ